MTSREDPARPPAERRTEGRAWHPWFAWRPVETTNLGFAWMRVLWRRHQGHSNVFWCPPADVD